MANVKPLHENLKGLIYKKFCDSREFISRLNEILFSSETILDKKFEEDKNKFYTKYSNQIALKRYSIGIFGKISSGKSTFLNYLLGLKDVLQVKSDVATKFVCFIRHNKNNAVPKFYEAIPENRKSSYKKTDFFNFEKGNEIIGNISEVISQRNKEIFDTEKNNEVIREALKYFIIIEANLNIFNDPLLEKYADIFEFLDIPGLDEGQFKDNPYLKNLIPIIAPNSAFSIFFFNGDSMEDTSTATIVKEITMYFSKNKIFDDKSISNEIDKKIALNSLYIINKVDNKNDYDEKKNILKKKLEEIFKSENYSYNVNELNIIPLSGRNLLFEANQLEDFYYFLGNTYIKYKQLDEKTRKEFKSYLSDELKPFSKTDKIKKEDDDSDSDSSDDNNEDNDNNELKNISENEKELIDDIKKISNNFSQKEYIKYKKKFNPKNKKEKKTIQSNELYQLYQIFNKIMEKIVGEFIKTEEFENLYQYLMKKKEKNKLIILSKKIVQNYKCIIDPIKTINELESNYKEGLKKLIFKLVKIF